MTGSTRGFVHNGSMQNLKLVLFMCLRLMNRIFTSQMMELGKTLEQCEKCSIWVVRESIGYDIIFKFKEE